MRIALLRAINVGGTGRLAMADLRAEAEAIGWTDVTTLGASGNIVYRSKRSVADDEARLRKALASYLKAPQLTIREGKELQALIDRDPFADADPAVPDKWRFTAFQFAPSDADLPEAPPGITFLGRTPTEVFYAMSEPTRHALDVAKKLERALGTPVTVRNLNVVRDLAARAAD